MTKASEAERLRLACSSARTKLRDAGMDVRGHSTDTNSLWLYERGFWRQVSPTKKGVVDAHLHAACEHSEIVFSRGRGSIWTHFGLSLPLLDHEDQLDKRPLIAMRNGTFDADACTLIPWDPEHYTTHHVDIDYDPAAKCPEWEALVKRMLEDPDRDAQDVQETHDFLQEFVGVNLLAHSARTTRFLKTALIMKGPPATGKSSIADAFVALVGEEYVAPISLQQAGTRFGLESLINAKALVNNDAGGSDTRVNTNILKQLITGDLIQVDRKGISAVRLAYNGAVVFSVNTLPTGVRDPSGAFFQRFNIVKLSRVFTNEDIVNTLANKGSVPGFMEHINGWPGVFNWAMEGYRRAKARGSYKLSASMVRENQDYEFSCNPALAFLKQCCVAEASNTNDTGHLSTAFVQFAKQSYNQRFAPREAAVILADTVRRVFPHAGVIARGSFTHITGVRLTEDGIKQRAAGEAAGIGEAITNGKINAPLHFEPPRPSQAVLAESAAQ